MCSLLFCTFVVHVCLFVCLFVCVFACLRVWLFVCLSVCLFFCLLVCLLARLLVCLYLCVLFACLLCFPVNVPAPTADIDYFEQNINYIYIYIHTPITVYVEYENHTIRADRITKIERTSCYINLLRIATDNNEHSVFTQDDNRLYGQTNNYNEKLLHCRYCQLGYIPETLLHSHVLNDCVANDIEHT